MEPLSATSRAANLQRLAQDQFDVLVIGAESLEREWLLMLLHVATVSH